MTYFRQRIGTTGFEKIFAVSIAVHGDQALEDEVCVDTTVQEKNITFPTDAKQYRKIHAQLMKLAQEEEIKLLTGHSVPVRIIESVGAHPRQRVRCFRVLNTAR